MSILLAALLLAQGSPRPPGGPQEPLKDWTYQRKEINPRTGREEVTAIIGGAEARPIDLTPRREVVEVRKVKARYFTEPRTPEEKSVEVNVEAERGRMDNGAGELRIQDGVRVVRPADGALLETSEALVLFPVANFCERCAVRRDKPGACPSCGGPLVDRTKTSVSVPREFAFTGPEGVLRGEGLRADDALRTTHVARHGYLELIGRPDAVARRDPKAVPRRMISQLACRGPLTITEQGEKGAGALIQAREDVRLDKIDETGTTTARAQEADIVVVRTPLGREIRELRARGRVEFDGVSFSDGMGVTATGASLLWTHVGLTFWSEDQARIEGSPATARIGGSEIRARSMLLEGPDGNGLFEGDVTASLLQGDRRIEVASRRLRARARPRAPAGWELREFEADGDVVLSGILPGEGKAPGRAEAERFRWNLAEQRGILEAARFVRIVQGTNTILAPRVVIEDGGSTVVLKGPKEIRFSQPAAEGAPAEELRASAEGDAVLYAGSGRIRMERACSIRTKEFRMTCDRVDALLEKEGGGVRSLRAAGNVRAQRPLDGVSLYGDRLSYDPVRRELEIFGSPFAVADQGRMVSQQERLVFFERTNGKPGSTVRYVEMRRGALPGIKITLTAGEKPPAGKRE